MLRSLFLILTVLFSHALSAKVRILTFHYNKPDFIELQHKCLKKFLLDDYELIVFNDAASSIHEQNIRLKCQKLGIECVRFEPEWHLADPLSEIIGQWIGDPEIINSDFGVSKQDGLYAHEAIANQPSLRHCHVIQYALDHYGYEHDDLVALMDGDAFFIRNTCLKDRLGSNAIIGISKPKGEPEYFWVPIVVFDPQKYQILRNSSFMSL